MKANAYKVRYRSPDNGNLYALKTSIGAELWNCSASYECDLRQAW